MLLRDNIHWVGYVDDDVRDFHGYDTLHGSTYNAYLVRDRQTALIDTVKAPHGEHLLRTVAAVVDLAEVNYVVCNHAEPDHSGGLPQVMAACPNATLVCDKRCAAALAQHYNTADWKTRLVASGETISLGRRTLKFLETPMVHWPESMFTYVPEERLLFSMDAFGQHYACRERFDDELPLETVLGEAKAYYANIVMPYGKAVTAVLGQVAGWNIETIAPSHGLIWRRHVPEILAAYRDWAAGRTKPKAVVLYDSMWGSTEAMAEAVLAGASQPGVETLLLHARRTTLTRIATEMLDAAAVAIGSSTLNREMMPQMAAALCYLHGLRPVHKSSFAFGSYGWGPGGPEAVQKWIESMQWHVLREPLRSQYRPTPAVLDECRAAGKMLAECATRQA